LDGGWNVHFVYRPYRSDNQWLTVAEYLSKEEAEIIADRANAALNG